jgi:hypothetical protein
MMSRRWIVPFLLVTTVVTSATTALAAPAQAREARAGHVKVPLVSDAAVRKTVEGWTEARFKAAEIAEAVPVKKVKNPGLPTGKLTGTRKGEPPKVAGIPKTVGRIFFRRGGHDYTCAATSVQNEAHNLVMTAGHCVYDVVGKAAVKSLVFVPGYNRGKAPYGVYAGKAGYLWDHFVKNGDFDFDVAFVRVHDGLMRDGDDWTDIGSLGDKVGGQGFAWTLKPPLVYTVFGYGPRQALTYCAGPSKVTAPLPKYGVNAHLGIACKLSDGAIGGPLIVKYDATKKLGYVNGVVSLVVTADGKRYVSSPYFGYWIRVLYSNATDDDS